MYSIIEDTAQTKRASSTQEVATTAADSRDEQGNGTFSEMSFDYHNCVLTLLMIICNTQNLQNTSHWRRLYRIQYYNHLVSCFCLFF